MSRPQTTTTSPPSESLTPTFRAQAVRFLTLFIAVIPLFAQTGPDTLWTRVHPLPEVHFLNPLGMVNMPDGGLYVAADYNRVDETHRGLFFLRFDSLGNLLWRQACLDSSIYLFHGGFCQLNPNRFLAVGSNFTSSFFDVVAVLVDSSGAAVWARMYEFPGEQVRAKVCVSADGNPVLACGTIYQDRPDHEILLLQLNATTGDILWTNSHSVPEREASATTIISTMDGGFAIAGGALIPGQMLAILMMKFDSQGSLEFYQTYSLGDWDGGEDIVQRPDGSYLICGNTQEWSTGRDTGFALSISETGDSLWSWHDPAPNYYAYKTLVLADGGFVVWQVGGPGTRGASEVATGFNASNALLWQHLFVLPDSFPYYADHAITLDDRGRMSVVGPAHDNINDYAFVAVLRTDSVSLAVRGRPSVGQAQDFQLTAFPNPFNSSTEIRFTLPFAQKVKLSIYDLTGRLVNTLNEKSLPAGLHSFTLDAGSLASGIYWCRLSNDHQCVTQKLALIR